MVNWIHFPKNKPLDKVSAQIVKAFEAVDATIDSYTHQLKSDEVLTAVRPGLEALGFDVEKSKKSDDLVAVPVLYGVNGKIEKAFEADGYLSTAGYVIEVEAGRAVVNYQFLKDFFEACTMVGVDKLCIAVRNKYRAFNDFDRVCKFFEAVYLFLRYSATHSISGKRAARLIENVSNCSSNFFFPINQYNYFFPVFPISKFFQ